MNLVDSSGWLEYFANEKNADFFAEPIEDTSNLMVPTINLYGVLRKVLQQKDEPAAMQAIALTQQGKISDVDPPISLHAAKQSVALNLPIADSIILATARAFHAKLWTQDSDLINLPDVIYIQK